MTVSPDLVFSRLDESGQELAEGLAALVAGNTEPQRETWGIAADGTPPLDGEAWGLYVRDVLAGTAWLLPVESGVVEIVALALPRGRWGQGLPVWMVGEAAKAVAQTGARELLVRLGSDNDNLASLLDEAGFTGPDEDRDDYPLGEWRRPCSLP